MSDSSSSTAAGVDAAVAVRRGVTGEPSAGADPVDPPDSSGRKTPAVTLSAAELSFLHSERRLGRLATSDVHGQPHVVPVGWRYNEQLGTFDVSGRNFATTRKYRNVVANPRAALVIDDVLPPWRPRCVLVQGPAQAVPADPSTGVEALIRLTPAKVTSWGLDEDGG